MIDQVDRELKAWVSNAGSIEETKVTLSPPGADQGLVSLYLIQVARVMTPNESPRNSPPPSIIMLHYLVSVQDDDLLRAHRLLGDLMFAALEEPDFEVNLDPFPLAAWTAFQHIPQPAFVLKVPLRRERPEREVKLVTKPLDLRAVQVTSLHGLLLGPEDIPVHGALVELPELQLVQRTNRKGAFLFTSIPAGARKRTLLIRAKGKVIEQTIQRPGTAADPVVVRVQFDD